MFQTMISVRKQIGIVTEGYNSVIGNAIVVPKIGTEMNRNRNILGNENVIKEEFFFNEIENGNGGYVSFEMKLKEIEMELRDTISELKTETIMEETL